MSFARTRPSTNSPGSIHLQLNLSLAKLPGAGQTLSSPCTLRLIKMLSLFGTTFKAVRRRVSVATVGKAAPDPGREGYLVGGEGFEPPTSCL